MLCTTRALALGVLLLAARVGGGGHFSRQRRGPCARAGVAPGVGVLEAGRRALFCPLPATSTSTDRPRISSFSDWPRTPAVRVCLRAVFRGGIVGRLFGLPVSYKGRTSRSRTSLRAKSFRRSTFGAPCSSKWPLLYLSLIGTSLLLFLMYPTSSKELALSQTSPVHFLRLFIIVAYC